MKTVGIMIDNWKLEGFETALKENGFTNYDVKPDPADTTLIRVKIPESEFVKLGNLVKLTNLNLQKRN